MQYPIFNSTKKNIAFAGLMAIAMLFAMEATAGNGGNFIKGLSDFIVEALEGYVGTVIGVAGILVGLVAGIMRQSMAGFGVGCGLAVGAYYGPNIVKAMAGAII